MLIAVTTSNGIDVDTHFGKAESFLVYEVGSGEPALRYQVLTPPYCGGSGPGHSLMPDKLAAIARALGDCRVVVTAMIGEAPREEMDRLGIDVISGTGPVNTLLQEVIKLY